MLRPFLEQVKQGQDLALQEAYRCAELLLSESFAPEEIAAFLSALAQKGESLSEVVGFAQAMRAVMVPIDLPYPTLDVCGTGGSGKSRFNVSSAVAFVLAAAGVPVVKHGNRGSKLPNGSFDFIEALGIPIDLLPEQQIEVFEKFNLSFLFARQYHPAVAKVAKARQLVGGPTIFNLLGPLCNPAKVSHQLLGTPRLERAELLAKALQQLGIERAWVVAGEDGRDEVSLEARTQILEVNTDVDLILASSFDPATLQPHPSALTELEGGTAVENAKLFVELIHSGNVEHPVMAWIALNAAAGMVVVGKALDIQSGYTLALELLRSKTVAAFFDRCLGAF